MVLPGVCHVLRVLGLDNSVCPFVWLAGWLIIFSVCVTLSFSPSLCLSLSLSIAPSLPPPLSHSLPPSLPPLSFSLYPPIPPSILSQPTPSPPCPCCRLPAGDHAGQGQTTSPGPADRLRALHQPAHEGRVPQPLPLPHRRAGPPVLPAYPHHPQVLPEILHPCTVHRPQGDAGGPQQLGCVPVARVGRCG